MQKFSKKFNNRKFKQFKVRSNLAAGESVEACLNNVAYWQKQYVDKCKKQGITVTPTYY